MKISLWFLPLSLLWLPSPGYAQDQFCFMVRPSGEVVDLTSLCPGRPAPAPASATGSPAPAPGFEPVVGGNDLVPAVLELERNGEVWMVSGFVGNRGPVGINIMAVQFDLLDEAGQVIYQGSITPIPDLSRVQAGTQQRVSTRVPANQVAGTPVSVVPVEVRYVR